MRVVSTREARPLPGVTVALFREPSTADAPPERTVSTDAAGRAVFAELRAGVFTLCARGARHTEVCERGGVVAGGTLTLEPRLSPGAVLVGQVLRADGSPAAGVQLVAEANNAPGLEERIALTLEARTDAEGRYRLEGLTPGELQFRSTSPEGQGRPRFVAGLKAGEETRFDFRFAGFAPVTIRPVVAGKGFAVGPVLLGTLEQRPQPDGTWTERVEAGPHEVRVFARRGAQSAVGTQKVTLSPGVPVVLRVPVKPERPGRFRDPLVLDRRPPATFFELAGHVRMPDGTPATGAWISVESPPLGPCGDVPREYLHTRFDGSAFVVRPRTGAGTVYAWLEDGRAGHIELDAREGERVVRDIHLEETGAVVGRMTPSPPDEWPQPHSLVVDGKWFGAWQYTRVDGGFVIAGLAPGAHALETKEGPVRFTVRAGERTELPGKMAPP